jgi:hypothetical protein
MGAMDFQLGVVDESTYGTAVVVTRFFEYNEPSTPIQPAVARTRGNPLRAGTRFRRGDRTVPYFDRAAGTISLDVMDKGFGFFLKHMMGAVVTAGAGPYTHTATEGALNGKSFTAQFNYPFNPSATNQAFTFAGGKINSWTLSNSVEGMLVAELECDFNSASTAVALATASYPTSMTNLSWAGGVISVGGSAIDVKEFSLEVNNNLDVNRRFIRGNTARKEPTTGQAELSFSLEAEFDALTQYNRFVSTTLAGLQAQIIATWTSGTSSLAVTIPLAEFDSLEFAGELGAINQSLSGSAGSGAASVCTLVYTTTDAVA